MGKKDGRTRFGWAKGAGLNKRKREVEAGDEEAHMSVDELKIERLTKEREQARAEGDYEKADEIR
jgi:cysteinyl-tRNA synthetase